MTSHSHRRGAGNSIASLPTIDRQAPELKKPVPLAVPRPGNSIRMLRLVQVLERTGLGKTKIYEMQNLKRFPMSVKVTETSVRWIESEVDAWLEERSRNRGARQRRRNAFPQKLSE